MQKFIRNHLDNTIDGRYIIRLEHCGYPRRRYVARFCSDYIGQSEKFDEALALAQEHYDNHKIDTCFPKV